MPPEIVGWDIGGAHLKAAGVDAAGCVAFVRQVPCPVWRGLGELDRALATLAPVVDEARAHAITMTAESADAFPDRATGVEAICTWATQRFAPAAVCVFDRAEGLIAPERAVRRVAEVGSTNWAATAAWVASRVRDALVLDIGSTTADLVPIVGGRCAATALGDHARLTARELVYTGVVRTPVMALAQSVPLGGRDVPLCAEVFATMGDVYRWLERLEADYDQAATADGRGRSREESAARLARMIGLDAEDAGTALIDELALALAARQMDLLVRAWEAVVAKHPALARAPIVALGAGCFLAMDLAKRVGVPVRTFASLVPAPPGEAPLARGITLAGPAVAVALLAHAAAAPVEDTRRCGW
jgi:probable H4MPT-linked C1 transfer pathway protein